MPVTHIVNHTIEYWGEQGHVSFEIVPPPAVEDQGVTSPPSSSPPTFSAPATPSLPPIVSRSSSPVSNDLPLLPESANNSSLSDSDLDAPPKLPKTQYKRVGFMNEVIELSGDEAISGWTNAQPARPSTCPSPASTVRRPTRKRKQVSYSKDLEIGDDADDENFNTTMPSDDDDTASERTPSPKPKPRKKRKVLAPANR